tara:strand:+ start:1052 stop:1270 length:219 start_codon:yes stop_codon:yes gene_type:complete
MSIDKKYVVVVYANKEPIDVYKDTLYIQYIFVKNTARDFESIRGCRFNGLIMDTFDLEDHLVSYLISRVRPN